MLKWPDYRMREWGRLLKDYSVVGLKKGYAEFTVLIAKKGIILRCRESLEFK